MEEKYAFKWLDMVDQQRRTNQDRETTTETRDEAIAQDLALARQEEEAAILAQSLDHHVVDIHDLDHHVATVHDHPVLDVPEALHHVALVQEVVLQLIDVHVLERHPGVRDQVHQNVPSHVLQEMKIMIVTTMVMALSTTMIERNSPNDISCCLFDLFLPCMIFFFQVFI